jgi:hypothetical protein
MIATSINFLLFMMHYSITLFDIYRVTLKVEQIF